MSTAFTATQDQLGTYWNNAATGGYPEIGVYLMQASELDATLADRATLAAIWAAGGNTEATFTNYVAKVLAAPTRTVDAATNRVYLGGAALGTPLPIVWANAGGATNNTIVKILYCYVPTSGAATSLILPLYASTVTAPTNGLDLVINVPGDGIVNLRNG